MKVAGQRVGIVGATGAVGQEILRVLERRNFPVASMRLLASARSVGKTLEFQGATIPVKELTREALAGLDLVFFSAGAGRSRQFAPVAVEAGALVIDNSSAFRMDPEVPLVVPEVNPQDLQTGARLIANPNCCAAILAVAIAPLHREAKIRRIVVSTYQSASGAGAQAMQELETQIRAWAAGHPMEAHVLPYVLAGNLFSHNTPVGPNGFNEEENKLIHEVRRMFHAPQMAIMPTCIRVPVPRAHSESVLLEFERPLSEDRARALLQQAAGVCVVDDRSGNHFPMPAEATGRFEVLVGRIRQEPGNPHGLGLFISGDQLLKGAAWNAVQIAEVVLGIESDLGAGNRTDPQVSTKSIGKSLPDC